MKSNAKKDPKTGSITFEGEINMGDPFDFEAFYRIVNDSDEKEAVELLKKKGYVIFKPTYEKL